jgi:hypothetical protein
MLQVFQICSDRNRFKKLLNNFKSYHNKNFTADGEKMRHTYCTNTTNTKLIFNEKIFGIKNLAEK